MRHAKRPHQMASDFVGGNTLSSQVSSYRSTFWAKVKSQTSCRKQQQAENDVSLTCAKCLNAMKVNRTLRCKRESLTADFADLVPICTSSAKETLGMFSTVQVCDVDRKLRRTQASKGGRVRGGVSADRHKIPLLSVHIHVQHLSITVHA